jgi:hypothetical protein
LRIQITKVANAGGLCKPTRRLLRLYLQEKRKIGAFLLFLTL